MHDLGWVAVDSTVRFMFTTHAASGAAVAPSTAFEAADLDVYKGSTSTPRSSANGITMTSPFATTTGLHLVAIDLSDNTDAGFYAAGSTYHVVLTPDETVDSLTVVKVVARFTIGVPPANTTQWLGTAAATPTVGGVPEVDVTHWLGTAAATPTTGGVPEVDVTHWRGTAAPAEHTAGYPIVTIKDGTGTGEIDTTSGVVSATVATGGIAAASFAANAIDAAALAAGAVDEILDDTIGDGTITVRQALRVCVAALSAKLSGAATTTVTIRNVADSADVIVATVDADGNRTATVVTP